MRGDHTRFEHQAHTEAIDAHVVADRVQVAGVLPHQRFDQGLRDAAKPKATDHDRGAIGNVGNRRIEVIEYLIHRFIGWSGGPLPEPRNYWRRRIQTASLYRLLLSSRIFEPF